MPSVTRRILTTSCLLLGLGCLTAEEVVVDKGYRPRPGGLPVVAPSENAGRTGQYRVSTSHSGYDYLVTVPDGYDPQQPVGINLFFHGQGGHKAAGNGWGLNKALMTEANLIGLNMIYMDGDNAKDTAGKVEAAKEALAQLMADYPIVPGRGVISSFSGGGLPHAMLMGQTGLGGMRDRGYHWPFCHTGLYGSNFYSSVSRAIPMTWVVAVGQKEWDLANLGKDGSARIAELARLASRGGNPDFLMQVEAGKGHSIGKMPHHATADMFRRSDLMLAPFVHLPDYRHRELSATLEACQALQYGRAAKALAEVLAGEGLAAEVREDAERLQGIVQRRADGIVRMIEGLATSDPLLAVHYGTMALGNHLRGHPAAERVEAAVASASQSEAYRAQARIAGWWFQNCGSLVRGGTLVTEHAPTVEQIAESVPGESIIGTWSAELLLLR